MNNPFALALGLGVLAFGGGAFLGLRAVQGSRPDRAPPTYRPARPIWLVVGRPGLIEAIEPLRKWRAGQGFETIASTKPLRAALRALPRRPSFVLLVGDDVPAQALAQAHEKDPAPWTLTAPRRPLYRWRQQQREQFASDAASTDLDGDLIPDIPIGRIPARKRADVELVVKKIIAYESQPPSLTDLRLIGWGGAPGYGAAIDRLATGLMLDIMAKNGPRWSDVWLLAGDARHPLAGWPPDQPALFARTLRQGGLLAVLIGHAREDLFRSMKHEKQWIAFSAKQAGAVFLAEGPPAPPLVMLACSLGNFAWEEQSLGEALLFMPSGPVALIGATTESHPLTNYFSGLFLLRTLEKQPPRLGNLWLEAQQEAMRLSDPLIEPLLRHVEGRLDDRIDLVRLRRDQRLMYAILGDPATRLRLPGRLEASVVRTASGWRWQVDKKPPDATRLHVGFRPRGALSVSKATKKKEHKKTAKNPQQARAAFRAFNARLAFQPLAVLSADQPWNGEYDRPGELRLVAETPGGLRVALLDLNLNRNFSAEE